MSTTFASAPVAEQTLSSSELEQARLYLEQAERGFVGAVRGLSEKQWRFKPAADQWSIAEIADHVIFVQERVLDQKRQELANAPAAPKDYAYKQVDDIVMFRIPSRLAKFKSPHQPSGELSCPEALDRVVRNSERLVEYLVSTPDLRQHAVEAPPVKAISNGVYEWMDGYQWIVAVAAHTDRHTKQILEVRALANFPEK